MKVKLLHEKAQLPKRGSEDAAGLDLYACEDVFIPVGETRLVPLGIAIKLQARYGVIPYLKIEDRSGMAVKGLRTGAGVVDFDYRGEVKVVLHNLNNTSVMDPVLHRQGYRVMVGDRVAQGIICNAAMDEPVQALELDSTERNAGGFGSTGS